jgi:hypothetical protein
VVAVGFLMAARTVFASGFGQGNYDAANAIGVDTPPGVTGYTPAPTALDGSSGSVTVNYTFTVHRYTGKNHVPFNQAIHVPLIVRAQKITAITGITDPGLVDGDPGLGNTAGTTGNPPFSEAFLLSTPEFKNVVESPGSVTISPSSTFSVDFPAVSEEQDQTVTENFTFTIHDCGYYELDTGNTAPDQFNNFAVLTTADVRINGCTTGGTLGISTSPTPTPATTGGVLGISTPGTGAASGEPGLGLPVGTALMGLGITMLAVARRRPSARHAIVSKGSVNPYPRF